MSENISESKRELAEVLTVILAGLAGLWWGVRMGDGILYVSGTDLRPFLCGLMIAGLLFQGYSNFKSNRKYSDLYRIMLWISGILISLLIYGLIVMVLGDIIVFIVRFAWGIHCIKGSGGSFHLLLYGASPDYFAARYGYVWGSRIWNYENPALLGLAVSVVITILGVIHARKITVRSYTIPLKGLKDSRHSPDPDHPGCRVVQLSDLHMGTVVTGGYIHRVLQRTAELRPDYVVLTGDIFNHGYVEECRNIEMIEKDFRNLEKSMQDSHSGPAQEIAGSNTQPSEGSTDCFHSYNASAASEPRIFAIVGNHDPLPDDIPFRDFLKKSGITLLHDRTVSLPEFYLAGRGGNHIGHRPPLNSWLSSSHPDKPVVLIDHYPDGIHDAEDCGVDLMLSGHTHGGQYFPCNLLIMKHYAHGLMHGYSEWGRTKSIVSWGAGFFQIPIRVGTDSEIVCVDLVPENRTI